MTHIKEPRPSCINAWKLRTALRDMLAHETKTINGVVVVKNGCKTHKKRYVIGDTALTFEDAIAVIEAARSQAA